MTNGRTPPKPNSGMPRANNLPPVGHNLGPMHDEFSQEAARAAQRYFDMTAQIAELTAELEGWRQRATLAEEEIRRAEMREQKLAAKLDATTDRLMAERDTYKDRLTTLKAEFATAGNIILHCIKVSEMMADKTDVHVQMDKLADQIVSDQAQQLEDELPRVVTAGPRTQES